MVQWVKALAAQPEDLRLIARIHMVEGENIHTLSKINKCNNIF